VPESVTRREFLGASGTTAASILLLPSSGVAAPAVHVKRPARPVAIASGNGVNGVARAYRMIAEGTDTLDAAVEGVKTQELDPSDTSVGYGGLPNEHGVVQLDASCMHGPSKRAGAVASLEGIKTPSEIARLVLKYTDHVLLVGPGAKQFALSYGYREEDLLTEESRDAWLRWRANRNPEDDYIDVPEDEEMVRRQTGTINLNVVSASGDISSVTSTSGLAWKIPGRVGDSALHGAGQYTDNAIGAAGSTGRGEANIKVCGAFLTVEHMRQGMAPTDACLATLRRAIEMSEPRLMREDGRPTFNLSFYAVNKAGQFGSASIYPGTYAVDDGTGAGLRDQASLYQEWP